MPVEINNVSSVCFSFKFNTSEEISSQLKRLKLLAKSQKNNGSSVSTSSRNIAGSSELNAPNEELRETHNHPRGIMFINPTEKCCPVGFLEELWRAGYKLHYAYFTERISLNGKKFFLVKFFFNFSKNTTSQGVLKKDLVAKKVKTS